MVCNPVWGTNGPGVVAKKHSSEFSTLHSHSFFYCNVTLPNTPDAAVDPPLKGWNGTPAVAIAPLMSWLGGGTGIR